LPNDLATKLWRQSPTSHSPTSKRGVSNPAASQNSRWGLHCCCVSRCVAHNASLPSHQQLKVLNRAAASRDTKWRLCVNFHRSTTIYRRTFL